MGKIINSSLFILLEAFIVWLRKLLLIKLKKHQLKTIIKTMEEKISLIKELKKQINKHRGIIIFSTIIISMVGVYVYWNYNQKTTKFHACRKACIESEGKGWKFDYCSAKCTEKYGIDTPW